MKNSQNQITLSVTFDYNELNNQLYWQILENGKTVEQESGRQTGMFELTDNSNFGVAVNAVNFPDGASVTMVDCHLVTMPILFPANNSCGALAGTYPYPSPFFVAPATPGDTFQGVTTKFSSQTAFTPIPIFQSNLTTWTWSSGNQPTVVNAGRWDTSFTMTVCVVMLDGTASYRVFGFDPETESTSGVTPP